MVHGEPQGSWLKARGQEQFNIIDEFMNYSIIYYRFQSFGISKVHSSKVSECQSGRIPVFQNAWHAQVCCCRVSWLPSFDVQTSEVARVIP